MPGRRWAAGLALLICGCSSDPSDSGTPVTGTGGVSVAGPASGGAVESAAGGSSGGTTAAGTGGTSEEAPPPPYEAPAAPLRRLTRTQFRNAVEDLTGEVVDIQQLDPDGYNGGFAATGAATVATSDLGAERYLSAVETAVEQAFSPDSDPEDMVGCTPATAQDACIADYLRDMGRRAWRRPLEDVELDALLEVVSSVSTELENVMAGVKWATVSLLGSMNFLYRPELGQPGATQVSRLTDYELASRLAFLLWNSLPDQELLDDAESGVLSTSSGIRDVATRMLAAPRGRESVGAFAEDYMRLDRVLSQAKDAGLFPEYGASLQKAMVVDMRETWVTLAFDDDASTLDLFSTRRVVTNSQLAQLYGLSTAGLEEDEYVRGELPEDSPRIGILGKPGFLSQFANQKEGSPTLRGKFISEALMCTEVPAPPGNVALELPESQPDTPTTKRQRLDLHREAPACARCHARMDPMGLPFESFDAIGRYRTTEHGLPIDSSGEFEGVAVADSRELGMAMSASKTIADCIVRKFYSYAVGHAEREVDTSVIRSLQDSFEASGYRLQPLILDIVTSEAFSQVAPSLEEVE